ncbi:MAG: hypothetical protein MJ082_01490 [Clostridia bacterium]|nr:hypothetical protein [Clostridia bacterium]
MKTYLALTAGGVYLLCLGLRFFFGEKNRKAAAFAFTVILLSLIAAPLAELVGSLPEVCDLSLSADGSEQADLTRTVSENAFTEAVRRAVCEKFSLPSETVSVKVRGFDRSALKAEGISVYLSGDGVFADVRRIRQYLLDNDLCGECYVEIG